MIKTVITFLDRDKSQAFSYFVAITSLHNRDNTTGTPSEIVVTVHPLHDGGPRVGFSRIVREDPNHAYLTGLAAELHKHHRGATLLDLERL